jgi:hypothetical protein
MNMEILETSLPTQDAELHTLLRFLLDVDPVRRIPVSQAVYHPWLQQWKPSNEATELET